MAQKKQTTTKTTKNKFASLHLVQRHPGGVTHGATCGLCGTALIGQTITQCQGVEVCSPSRVDRGEKEIMNFFICFPLHIFELLHFLLRSSKCGLGVNGLNVMKSTTGTLRLI